jgi:hypothetical protein
VKHDAQIGLGTPFVSAVGKRPFIERHGKKLQMDLSIHAEGNAAGID